MIAGDKASPDARLRFDMNLARNGLAERQWEIKLTGGTKGDVVVAQLDLTDKELTFQWTADAAKNDDAGYLQNCLLQLRTADHEHFLALRQAVNASSIPVNLARAAHREKFEIPYAADPAVLVVELLKVEGIEKFVFEPKAQLGAKQDATFVWFGEEGNRLLGLKVDTIMQKDLQVSVTPVINDPTAGPIKLVAKQVAAAQAGAVSRVQALSARLQSLKTNPQAAQLANQISTTEQQLEGAKTSLAQFEKLGTQYEAINGKGQLQYRVFFTDGTRQVDLVRGQAAPLPDAGARH
jgi:hypothetical protein